MDCCYQIQEVVYPGEGMKRKNNENDKGMVQEAARRERERFTTCSDDWYDPCDSSRNDLCPAGYPAK